MPARKNRLKKKKEQPRRHRRTVPPEEQARLTGRAISKLTGIRPHTVYAMMATGEIPSIYVNTRRMCMREDFERWWAQYLDARRLAPAVQKLNPEGSVVISALEFSRESGIKYDLLQRLIKNRRLPPELISVIDGKPWIVRHKALEWAANPGGAE